MSYQLRRKHVDEQGVERWEVLGEFPSIQAANGMKGHFIGKGLQDELRVVPTPRPAALFAVGPGGREVPRGGGPECYVFTPLGEAAREFRRWLGRPTEGQLLARAWLKGVPLPRLRTPNSGRA